jgi:hypothetical protein
MERVVTVAMLDNNPEWRARLRKKWDDCSITPSTIRQNCILDNDAPELLTRQKPKWLELCWRLVSRLL